MSCTIRDIQLKECEMLKKLDCICKKYNIKYYLAQGTLIGAARHKAFIPWDDDIDVLVPHYEFKLLMEKFSKEYGDEYLITNHKVEKHYPLTWTKIRAYNTLSRPKRYKDIPVNWGICIDLFPVYPLSNNSFLRNLEIFIFKVGRKMLMAEMTPYDEKHNIITRMLEKVPIRVRHIMVDFGVKIFSSHKNDTKYVYAACKNGKVLKREWIFGEEKTLEFEGDEYPVPTEYHNYLTNMYGDYMTPPPIEEQCGHELNLGDIEWRL